jgi:ribosomal-protein-alanine N-acetyltransferase
VIEAVPAGPSPLHTDRLMLRELVLDDAEAVATLAGDRRVARHLVQVPSPYPIALAKRWVASRIEWWAAGRGVTLAIVFPDKPRMLFGTVSLRAFHRDRRAELGYWLAADEWGHGYAAEAARATVELGFDQLSLARIYAHVIAGNQASCRVLDKLGFVLEGVQRQHMWKAKRLHDVLLYGVLFDEWVARQTAR